MVFAGVAIMLWLLVRVGRGATVPWTVANAPTAVSTDPGQLPYFAARSLLRMFAALGLSLVFTFVYATAAARSRRAERILIPLLDMLQSVPVLGFLAVTITGFIALFPGSLLGLECASIFAIFTSQAWNMTFAFCRVMTSCELVAFRPSAASTSLVTLDSAAWNARTVSRCGPSQRHAAWAAQCESLS